MEGKNLKIIFVIDESGSMQGSESDVIGGFNSYIEQQLTETIGNVTVSLYKFNSKVTKVVANAAISEIKLLSSVDYQPGGFTALYDAIGLAITDADNELVETAEHIRPDKVLMVIITDGQENASVDFSSKSTRTLIASHESLLKWDFIYLGTGLKDFADADALGLKNRVNDDAPAWKRRFEIVAESSVRYRKSNSTDNVNILNDLMSDLNDE